FVLPPREIADDLLRCYWDYSHPVFPVLHRPTVMSEYEKFWAPGSFPDRHANETNNFTRTLSYITVNMVFAIGSQFTTVVKPAAVSGYGAEFYQRSRKLMNFEIMDSVQLATIQILLLTGVYLYYEQPTTYADRCWNIVGLTIRSSQALGLHSEYVGVPLGQLDREMRRRVWHCAILLD
ncbi:hypothetical protein NA57DRAFT_17677, partial [Rhizodiscina lignyota]